MYSFMPAHESRKLKQARPKGQYVDLLRPGIALATPSQQCGLYHNAHIMSTLDENCRGGKSLLCMESSFRNYQQ